MIRMHSAVIERPSAYHVRPVPRAVTWRIFMTRDCRASFQAAEAVEAAGGRAGRAVFASRFFPCASSARLRAIGAAAHPGMRSSRVCGLSRAAAATPLPAAARSHAVAAGRERPAHGGCV